jgi:hypothetical protein
MVFPLTREGPLTTTDFCPRLRMEPRLGCDQAAAPPTERRIAVVVSCMVVEYNISIMCYVDIDIDVDVDAEIGRLKPLLMGPKRDVERET